MTSEIIKFAKKTITLCADSPKSVGTEIDLLVKLPEGMILRSFPLEGTVTDCELVSNNGSSCYVLEVKIGDVSPLNEKILEAYKDYLERKEILDEIKIDFVALKEVFEGFAERLRQLRMAAEEARNNVKGTLEMLRRTSSGGKTTIH